MTAFFWLFLHSVSSYRWLHLIDGSPNARGQDPINSLRPNIIVSHFSKRAPFDLVSPCTCTLANPDGSSGRRMIIKTSCRWKISRQPEIICNKSSSYRSTGENLQEPTKPSQAKPVFPRLWCKQIEQISWSIGALPIRKVLNKSGRV